MMRQLASALAAGCALALLGLAPTSARARDLPFCIKGDGYPSLGDCSFTTYEQCQATASGRNAWCDRNYYYDSPSPSYAAPYPYAPASKRRRAHG